MDDSMNLLALLSKINRLKQSYLEKRLKPYGISGGVFPFLIVLEKNEGISQVALSQILSMDKALTARTVSKLIKMGLVYNNASEDNKWTYQLYLTDEAKRLIPTIRNEVDSFLMELLVDLEASQTAVVMETLNLILSRLTTLNNAL